MSYSPSRTGSLFRRFFDRAESINSTSPRAPEMRDANGANRDLIEPNTSDETERVSQLLHSTVLGLWREEHASHLRSVTEDVVATQANSANGAAPSKEAASSGSAVPTWKRLFDVTFILVTSPLWLPLMLFLMLAVRLSSAGPIFYQQERVGYHGRRFMIYKFRSMKVDAETDVHEAHLERLMRDSVPMAKLDGQGDPRILPWGRILRATGLDELPQIFNVLRGEMSLVGPRPCTIHEFSRYAKWQRERVNALPGLTGYWQVNGKNKTTFNEMIEMDIYYAKNLSLGLDLKIVLQTLPALADQTFESITSRRPRRIKRSHVSSEIKTSQGI